MIGNTFSMGRMAAAVVAAAGLAIVAMPAKAQDPYYGGGYYPEPAYTTPDVIVTAPRTMGRSAIGAPIERVRASRVVEFRDLDLSRPWGADALRYRIRSAARDACDELDFRYPITVDTGADCYNDAVHNAMIRASYVTGYDIAEW
jgi:UrcA family protein